MNKELKERIIRTLAWMITDMKYRSDLDTGCLGEGTEGNYSSELQEAIKLLNELKKES